ncbi:hypothetical protein F5Y16DRAFT_356417 [Xylariaceae sp. FL0255]|nr:hypothetical protein F5Y16DRAFT_356417 [Xylariaceae sp. FL0255]
MSNAANRIYPEFEHLGRLCPEKPTIPGCQTNINNITDTNERSLTSFSDLDSFAGDTPGGSYGTTASSASSTNSTPDVQRSQIPEPLVRLPYYIGLDWDFDEWNAIPLNSCQASEPSIWHHVKTASGSLNSTDLTGNGIGGLDRPHTRAPVRLTTVFEEDEYSCLNYHDGTSTGQNDQCQGVSDEKVLPRSSLRTSQLGDHPPPQIASSDVTSHTTSCDLVSSATPHLFVESVGGYTCLFSNSFDKAVRDAGDRGCPPHPESSVSCKASPSQSTPCYSTTTSESDSTASSDYEDDIEPNWIVEHLKTLIPILIEELLGEFFNRQSRSISEFGAAHRQYHGTSATGSGSYTNGLNATNYSQSNESNSVKRKRTNSSQSPDEENGEDEVPDPPTKKQRVAAEDMLMACPFSKWKPLSYSCCYKYIMKDIRRVKQHLRRYHKRPLHCPICWQTFSASDEEGFYSHIQSRSCEPRPRVDLEGVTATQQENLERRVDRRLSKSDQWYSVFSILFPNSPLPASPYLEASLSAELLSFQKFMAVDGLQIVEQTAREHVPNDLTPQAEEIVAFSQLLFQQAIPKILQMYETARPYDNSPDSGYGTTVSNNSSNRCSDQSKKYSPEFQGERHNLREPSEALQPVQELAGENLPQISGLDPGIDSEPQQANDSILDFLGDDGSFIPYLREDFVLFGRDQNCNLLGDLGDDD